MDKHVVTLCIKDEDALYLPFSPEKEFSSDVTDYLTSMLGDRSRGQKVALRVVSPSPIDEDAFRAALNRWAMADTDRLKREQKANFVKQIWMFGVGVAFIAASLVLESVIPVLPYMILSTIGAFAMWEAASIWIIQGPQLRLRRRVIERVTSDMELEFHTEA